MAELALASLIGSSIYQGVEANAAGRRQGKALDENARLAILEGEQAAQQTRLDERRRIGAALASFDSSVVAGELISESAFQREKEILNLRTRAAGEANTLYGQAADARGAGRAALIGGLFGATAGAIQGASANRASHRIAASDEKLRKAQMGGGGSLVPRPVVVGGQ